ncbi:DUF4339 domain-containing protein [Solimonas sp. K1W22B-7]|uniref:RDD family protein n=1 Tax=Solimonas sp. K1W22B-7 TaxID=2303331 RepID=UPI000E334C58|nr:RDD family protein [Solimonas sp. K1W22B-7]AXQ31448.1 DUF4339 domain-containing protein [Solimonas sp. K1W22B-7]
MSEQIYLARDGQQTGPYTRTQLAGRAARGEVQQGDFAWQPGQPAWVPAYDALGLLGISLPQAATAPPPLPAAARQRTVPAQVNVPAGHGARIGANLLDTLLGSLLSFVAFFIGGALGGDNPGAVLGYGYLLAIVFIAAYFGLTHSSEAMASFGKRATGLIVVDKHGQRIGFVRGALRYLAMLLGAFFWLPMMMVLFNRRHRGLHDMLAGTVVIEKDTYEPELWDFEQLHGKGGAAAIVIALFLFFIFFIGILAAIAIPAYQDYTIRAKVTGALIETRVLKAVVGEHLLNGEDAVVSYEELGMPGPKALPQYGATIEVQPEGAILIRFDAPTPVAGKSVVLTPINRGIEGWHCRGGDDMPQKYLPADCRQSAAQGP